MAKTYKLSEDTARFVAGLKAKANDRSQVPQSQTRPGTPPALLVVRITGPAAGGGKYEGVIVAGPAGDVSASGNLTSAELSEAATGERPVLVCNFAEAGMGLVHNLGNRHVLARPWRVNADGLLVVVCDTLDMEGCTT